MMSNMTPNEMARTIGQGLLSFPVTHFDGALEFDKMPTGNIFRGSWSTNLRRSLRPVARASSFPSPSTNIPELFAQQLPRPAVECLYSQDAAMERERQFNSPPRQRRRERTVCSCFLRTL